MIQVTAVGPGGGRPQAVSHCPYWVFPIHGSVSVSHGGLSGRPAESKRQL